MGEDQDYERQKEARMTEELCAPWDEQAGDIFNCFGDHICAITIEPNKRHAALIKAAPDMLAFAESIANHRSGNLHGFYSKEVTAARRIVNLAGGKLRAIGRYKENESEPMSHDEYDKYKRIKKGSL